MILESGGRLEESAWKRALRGGGLPAKIDEEILYLYRPVGGDHDFLAGADGPTQLDARSRTVGAGGTAAASNVSWKGIEANARIPDGKARRNVSEPVWIREDIAGTGAEGSEPRIALPKGGRERNIAIGYRHNGLRSVYIRPLHVSFDADNPLWRELIIISQLTAADEPRGIRFERGRKIAVGEVNCIRGIGWKFCAPGRIDPISGIAAHIKPRPVLRTRRSDQGEGDDEPHAEQEVSHDAPLVYLHYPMIRMKDTYTPITRVQERAVSLIMIFSFCAKKGTFKY
jgi:hypothetical protein